MAAPFLASLSRTARMAYPIVQKGIAEGQSSREITRVLQDAGLGIRRQALLELIRLEKDVQVRGSQLRYMRPDAIPNPARLPEALTRLRRPFSFTVEVRGTRADTGEPWKQHVTITTDRLLSRGTLEDMGLEAAERGSDRYAMRPETSVLIGGLRAGPLGTL